MDVGILEVSQRTHLHHLHGILVDAAAEKNGQVAMGAGSEHDIYLSSLEFH